jgi:hypothetical protein
MYSTCLFCNRDLGSNDVVEHFPVGRRLAFDSWKGRLWVVCPHCRQWNLTPIEERYEAVEECERLFRVLMARVSTDNIGLAVHRSGLDLVRIGPALRPEFAAWRYAGNFSLRRSRSRLVKGAATAGAGLAIAGTGSVIVNAFTWSVMMSVGPLIYPAIAAAPVVGMMLTHDYLKHDRVVGRFARGGSVLTVRARHAEAALLAIEDAGATTLSVPHDDGRVTFAGPEAIHAVTVILANSNNHGGSTRVVQDAVHQIEASGSVERFLDTAVRRRGQRRGRMLSALRGYRGLGAMNLSLTERLALEMAMHEESERRAMEGELELLEEAWKDAEEIAEISDGMLTSLPLPAWLREAWRDKPGL